MTAQLDTIVTREVAIKLAEDVIANMPSTVLAMNPETIRDVIIKAYGSKMPAAFTNGSEFKMIQLSVSDAVQNFAIANNTANLDLKTILDIINVTLKGDTPGAQLYRKALSDLTMIVSAPIAFLRSNIAHEAENLFERIMSTATLSYNAKVGSPDVKISDFGILSDDTLCREIEFTCRNLVPNTFLNNGTNESFNAMRLFVAAKKTLWNDALPNERPNVDGGEDNPSWCDTVDGAWWVSYITSGDRVAVTNAFFTEMEYGIQQNRADYVLRIMKDLREVYNQAVIVQSLSLDKISKDEEFARGIKKRVDDFITTIMLLAGAGLIYKRFILNKNCIAIDNRIGVSVRTYKDRPDELNSGDLIQMTTFLQEGFDAYVGFVKTKLPDITNPEAQAVEDLSKFLRYRKVNGVLINGGGLTADYLFSIRDAVNTRLADVDARQSVMDKNQRAAILNEAIDSAFSSWTNEEHHANLNPSYKGKNSASEFYYWGYARDVKSKAHREDTDMHVLLTDICVSIANNPAVRSMYNLIKNNLDAYAKQDATEKSPEEIRSLCVIDAAAKTILNVFSRAHATLSVA